VQFGIFLWIMNMVAEQKILWWFIASLLPWALDWSVPASPWFLLLGAAVAIAVAAWIGRVNQRATSLQQQGIRATGTVLEVLKPFMKMNVVINNVYIQRRLRLRIQREDGMPPYEGILKGLFMLGEIPSVGDRLALRVDPANPQHFDYDKASTSAAAATADVSSDLSSDVSADATSAQSFGSRRKNLADSGHRDLAGHRREDVAGVRQKDLADELARLSDLRDRGALTDSEFAAAKKKLLR
jgi:hypothetical protein